MASIISAGTTSGTSLNLSGDTSGVLQLASNGSTTAVTVDTSQNVGIGTASPAFKLDAVVTGNSLNSIIAARNTTSGTAAGSQILVGNDSSNDLLVLRALSSTYTSSGVNTANGVLVRGGGAGGMTLAATDAAGIIKFATGGTTEQMRIASDGTISTTIGSTLYGAYPARAWVNFDGTGTPAIRSSRNVSSITDNGTGLYTLNFTTAMPDNEYSLLCTGGELVNGYVYASDAYTTAPTTSSVRTINHRPGVGNADSAYLFAAVFR